MVLGAQLCELTNGFLWFVCGLYVGILMSPLRCYHKGKKRKLSYAFCKQVQTNSPHSTTVLSAHLDLFYLA